MPEMPGGLAWSSVHARHASLLEPIRTQGLALAPLDRPQWDRKPRIMLAVRLPLYPLGAQPRWALLLHRRVDHVSLRRRLPRGL